MQFHHFERYCPHLFGSEVKKVEKFVWSLGEGPMAKVMGTTPDTLTDVIGIAMRFDKDFTHSQEARMKKGLIYPLTRFKKIYQCSGGHKNHHENHLER